MCIIGRLGVPLGTVVEIEAVILDGDTLNTKAGAGTYLLKIEKVGGKNLIHPVISDFGVHPWDDIKLANDPFSLYKVITGAEAHSLKGDDIERFKKGYIGSRCRLLVYESGGFSGIPNGLPGDYMLWQDHGFGFETYLFVLRVLEHNWRPNNAAQAIGATAPQPGR